MLFWDQHVSAKAWRFHNNLFQLVHSGAVTSIFFPALGASSHSGLTQEQSRQCSIRPSEERERCSGGTAQISNNKAEKEQGINICSSLVTQAFPTRRFREMTLSIGVNWTRASGFQAASLPWGSQGS